ncbi:MAG: proline--tRNA ligase [Mesosutterella sp.]|nr:proline--tRNA ligase [Mesosutterella sp.]
MRAQQFFISTLKEAPADADIASQKLMIRAGMIKKLAAGVYTYMPMGLRVIRKIENIVREEMDRAGSIEMLMPIVQPAELWKESGRWEKYGPELLRFKDRHDRDFVIQPTSEEVITDFARQEITSWRQLPVNFYQIQTKFRDERRPRFGLMRGREFIMKDAYSFDRDAQKAGESYKKMFDAYCRIFSRTGLVFRPVAADTGSIGGSRSNEFQVIADTGEDLIAYSTDSGYAANIELAEALPPAAERQAPKETLQKVPTPGCDKCESVTALLGLPLTRSVKSVVLAADRTDEAGRSLPARIVLVLLRGDHSLNEVKVGKLPELKDGFRFATEAEILEAFGSKPGYLGPVGLDPQKVKVYGDLSVRCMSDFVVGANEEGFHLRGVNFGRDFPEPQFADLRNVVEGDPSPDGQGTLKLQRGIEVGHVFYLGTKYSSAMGATYLDEQGHPQPLEMGCYGIGISRVAGAAIEQNHDDKGIIWPEAIAPFEVVICPMGYRRSEAVREACDRLHDELQKAGVDVILDDRDMRPGPMFADWELIGVPHRIVVGDRGLKNGEVEYTSRRSLDKREMVRLENAAAFILEKLKAARA